MTATLADHLIIFEGPDGVGKTTLAEALTASLKVRQVPAEYLSFPGREPGTLGNLVYRLHHASDEVLSSQVSPAAMQALHVAAHLDAIEHRILPLLRSGHWVILDRYWWSTWVYGIVGGVPRNVLEAMIALEQAGWQGLRPATVFLVNRAEPWVQGGIPEQWRSLVHRYDEVATQEAKEYRVERVTNDRPVAEVVESLNLILRGQARRRGERAGFPFEPRPRSTPRQARDDHQMALGLASVVRHRQSIGRRPSTLAFAPARPTPVFDTYWRFAVERQAIFLRRFEGQPPPWTKDPILARHKFTNAYRASDRASQYVIGNVIYQGEQRPRELFFRTLLFKLFNRIETWELLKRALGTVSADEFSVEKYDRILGAALGRGERIYSAAYIMPAADRLATRKHVGHLRLLDRMLRDDLPQRLEHARSLRQAFELLRGYPMMGDFLAYQYIIDLNYSSLLDFSEMEFVVPGPGARSGIRKCFRDTGGLSEADLIRLVTERQQEEFARRDLPFQALFGRPLQLVDCQNLFCEVDKYARVAHPEVKAGSGRDRIKQVFRSAGPMSLPWYPPKWGLNERIQRAREAVGASADR